MHAAADQVVELRRASRPPAPAPGSARRNRPTSPSIAALLVRAFLAHAREARLVEVVRAQRDEPVGLHPPAAAQHPLDRRAEVVVSDQAEHAAEELKRGDVPLQERLLGLARMRLHEARPREARAHLEQDAPSSPRRRSPPSPRPSRPRPPRPALSTTARTPRRPTRRAALTALAHIPADLPLGHLHAMLVTQPLVDPLRRVPLLARRRPISHQATNRSAPATHPASAPAAPPAASAPAAPPTPTPAGPSVDARHAGARARAIDSPSNSLIPADLLEQLHSRSHPFRDLPSTLDRAPKVDSRIGRKWGQIKRGGFHLTLQHQRGLGGCDAGQTTQAAGVQAEKQQRYLQLIAQEVNNLRRAGWLGSIERPARGGGMAGGSGIPSGSSCTIRR